MLQGLSQIVRYLVQDAHWRIVGLSLTLALLAMVVFPQAPAFAASFTPHRVASPAHGQQTGAAASIQKTASCVMTSSLSPGYQQGPVGHTFSLKVNWSCGPAVYLVVTLDWGDGSLAQNYTCWVNCGSGTTTFSQSITRAGTFYPADWTNITPEFTGTATITTN